MKSFSEIVGAIVSIVITVPIVSWLVPSPEFSDYAMTGVLLGSLAGGITHAYLDRKVVSKIIARLWPPALWLFVSLTLWAFYKFAWKDEILAATKGNAALVGIAVLFFALLTSFVAALLASALADRALRK